MSIIQIYVMSHAHLFGRPAGWLAGRPTVLRISFDDLDLHSRSQLFEKSKTYDVHFLANLDTDLDEIQYIAATCWFVEAHAEFVLLK